MCVYVCERWFLTRNKKGTLFRRQEGFQSQTGDTYTSTQTKDYASRGGVCFRVVGSTAYGKDKIFSDKQGLGFNYAEEKGFSMPF